MVGNLQLSSFTRDIVLKSRRKKYILNISMEFLPLISFQCDNFTILGVSGLLNGKIATH